jgi:uncharacterized SAM-binding protein YcdF (DUF218 family)
MRGFVRTHGLDERRMIFKGQARNTCENALSAKPLARSEPGERWLLVTSAFTCRARWVHSLRSAGR